MQTSGRNRVHLHSVEMLKIKNIAFVSNMAEAPINKAFGRGLGVWRNVKNENKFGQY